MRRGFVSVLVVLALTAGAYGDSASRQGAVAPSGSDLDALLAPFADDLAMGPDMLPAPAPQALIDLGAELFFSKALSGNFDTACASCHHPFLGGADGLSLPVGESAIDPDRLGPGRRHDAHASKDRKADGAPNLPRHTPTIFNTSLLEATLFTDGRLFVLDGYPGDARPGPSQRTPDSIFAQADPNAGLDLLATQARFPVVSPQEMAGFGALAGATNDAVRTALAARLKEHAQTGAGAGWGPRFAAAFGAGDGPSAPDAITFQNIQKALSAYQSSKLTLDAPWFDFVDRTADALTPEQKNGARLFFAAPEAGGAGCVTCHAPPLFTDEGFHNIAVPQFGRGIQADGADYGRRHVTQIEADRYRFRTPSLLNIAKTAPYGHTGAFLTLERMIAHHLDPAASVAAFDFSFADNPQLAAFGALYGASPQLTADALSALEREWDAGTSVLPRDLALGDRDVRALAAFLEALTDPCMEDRACLSRWLPKGPPPDGHRLDATFGPFETEDATPAPAVALRRGQGAWSVPTATPAAREVPATLSVQCDTAPVPKSGRQGFEEVGLEVGLSDRHTLSWSLYSARHAQRVLFTGGIAVGDVDGDCRPDIYLPTGDVTPDKLYLNQPDGRFVDVSAAWGVTEHEFSNGATLVDLDGDGDLDAVVTNVVHPSLPSIGGRQLGPEAAEYPTVYRNVGNDRFELWPDAGFTAIGTSWSMAFGDYDLDGDLDGVSTHWRGAGIGGPPPNHLWRQDQTEDWPVFVAADADAGLSDFTGKSDFTFTSIFSDVDLDGAPDLLVAADFENSEHFRNTGLGTFQRRTDRTVISDENGMGAAVADYDNDGDLDWFVTSVWDPNGVAEGNWGVSGNKLYRNDGGSFAEVASAAGVTEGYWGWGACFADFDNDSWPDLFHTTGFDLAPEMAPALGGPRVYHQLKRIMAEFEKTPSLLFMSNRDGTFTERAAELGVTDRQSGRATVCFDYDRDGDIDILVSNHQGRPLFYRNMFRGHPESNFVSVRLSAPGPNRQAVGAKVFVTANGVRQLQEMRAGGSFLAGSPYELHFGVGDAPSIEKIEVQWPGPDRAWSMFEHVPANQFLTIERAAPMPSDDLVHDRRP